jgi:hypothetical protein
VKNAHRLNKKTIFRSARGGMLESVHYNFSPRRDHEKRFVIVRGASAVQPRDLKTVPNPKMMEPTNQPVAHNYPAAKDQADSIIGGVHASSCYISTVRCIDYDPAADAAFVIYRNQAGTSCNYIGSTDRGANWTLITTVNTLSGVRYPTAMVDQQNVKPWAFWNAGFGANPLYGIWCANDAAGYNGGLWDPETHVDTLGNGGGVAAYYVGTAFKGTNGVIHLCYNYWGDFTPDAAFYFRSTDDATTWNLADPRSGNLMMYDLTGTPDSNVIFGTGNPVVTDPIVAGYINQVMMWASPTGDTVLVGSNGLNDSLTGTISFWYRMSYDAGVTWTPFTYAPDPGQISWPGESYDIGIALDKEGYPHFATFLFLDTTAAGNFGPNTGLVDYHLTSGGWVKTVIHQIDSLGTNLPRFANFGMDVDGNLYVSYADNAEGSPNMNIWLAYSADNGASYTKKLVTTDAAGYDYPHLPRRIGGATSLIPVWYQRANAGFVSWVTPMGVAGSPAPVAQSKFALKNAYPNPASSRATIAFQLPKAGAYSLNVYNIAGQLVKSINGQGNVGVNNVTIDTKNMANGVLFYQLKAGANSATGKLTVVR